MRSMTKDNRSAVFWGLYLMEGLIILSSTMSKSGSVLSPFSESLGTPTRVFFCLLRSYCSLLVPYSCFRILGKETQAQRGDIIFENIYKRLRIVPAKRSQHLMFNFHDFRFFNSSEKGSAMPFGNSRLLALLIVAPYVLSCEVVFFRKRRYFVKIGNCVVAVFILHERPNILYISSLAVAPEFRRLGIATCILSYTERVAKRWGKSRLELSVLRKNLPAQALYEKLGFEQAQERRRVLVLAKKI
jgi:ribosomal protein S18 acetylase RimI-like enzyme